MTDKRWLIFLIVLFLMQFAILSEVLSDTNFPLTQIKVDSVSSDKFFKKIYESACIGLSIYKLDVMEKYTKERLAAVFHAGGGNGLIKFDMNNVDMDKKGWTRYYPFSIYGKDFIMRIFLTEEKRYQHSAPILYEGNIQNPAVTFQVLPSLNEILSDCKIKPHRTYSTRSTDSSS
ncbi:MAG: hypothetical protein Q8R38_05195 [Candidatus Omnitrophota bacterium]|nr:hypothetical protein [Candidatus Omnitrophota bacterium]